MLLVKAKTKVTQQKIKRTNIPSFLVTFLRSTEHILFTSFFSPAGFCNVPRVLNAYARSFPQGKGLLLEKLGGGVWQAY